MGKSLQNPHATRPAAELACVRVIHATRVGEIQHNKLYNSMYAMPSNTACAQAHAFHTPGYDATLSEYTRKFGHPPPQSIWGIMGESGSSCGSSCGGGGTSSYTSSYTSGGSSGRGRSSGPPKVIKPMTPEEKKKMKEKREKQEKQEQNIRRCILGFIGFVVLSVYVLWPLAKHVCGDGGDCNDVTRLGNVLCVDIESTNASKGGQSKPWVSTNTRTGTGHTCQQYLIQSKCNLCKEKGPDWESDWGEFRNYATRMADGGGLGCRGGGGGAIPQYGAVRKIDSAISLATWCLPRTFPRFDKRVWAKHAWQGYHIIVGDAPFGPSRLLA